jgi:hypothetical protein
MPTNRERFFKEHGIPLSESLSLDKIAELSGMPRAALQESFNRGVGAARTNPQSIRLKGSFKKDPSAPRSMKLSDEQWAYARTYAFVMKTPKVFYGADRDIAEKYGLIERMPYCIVSKAIDGRIMYAVKNKMTGKTHGYTTEEKAKAQMRILQSKY